MSLKFFHILFIAISIVLAFGLCVWSILTYQAGMGGWYLVLAIASLLVGGGLIVYGYFFLRKFRQMGR